ncbi:hypothetical protein CEXT_417381 [Caerostris extrusa]|uniref:Uncharacterized protein n=1 Tax=Caerostris extrusa TaxID=172846 RepID=A0AAV4NMD1_CAEEX|nr:hypothetical protein CEXT_417381 [Caerostris extrusa]
MGKKSLLTLLRIIPKRLKLNREANKEEAQFCTEKINNGGSNWSEQAFLLVSTLVSKSNTSSRIEDDNYILIKTDDECSGGSSYALFEVTKAPCFPLLASASPASPESLPSAQCVVMVGVSRGLVSRRRQRNEDLREMVLINYPSGVSNEWRMEMKTTNQSALRQNQACALLTVSECVASRHHFPGSSPNNAASGDPLTSVSRRISPCVRSMFHAIIKHGQTDRYLCSWSRRVIQRLGCRLVGLSCGLGSHRRQRNEDLHEMVLINYPSQCLMNGEWSWFVIFVRVKRCCIVIIRPSP